MFYADRYYVISEEEYNQCFNQPQDIDLKIQKLPQLIKIKCKKLLVFLHGNGLSYNSYGIVNDSIPEIGTPFNLLEFLVYCISGKGHAPWHIDQFIQYLHRIKVPTELLCLKIKKKIIKLKNKKELKK